VEFWFPGKIAVKGVKNGQKDVSIETQFLLFRYVLLIVFLFFLSNKYFRTDCVFTGHYPRTVVFTLTVFCLLYVLVTVTNFESFLMIYVNDSLQSGVILLRVG